jgi:hypothetical protein
MIATVSPVFTYQFARDTRAALSEHVPSNPVNNISRLGLPERGIENPAWMAGAIRKSLARPAGG